VVADDFLKLLYLYNACPKLVRKTTTEIEGSAKTQTSLRNDDQAPGLTSILSLTRTPGFALFANSIAFSRAAWERTVPDSVTSFLSASAFTLRSASFNCASFFKLCPNGLFQIRVTQLRCTRSRGWTWSRSGTWLSTAFVAACQNDIETE
jgi:hypothetical protein